MVLDLYTQQQECGKKNKPSKNSHFKGNAEYIEQECTTNYSAVHKSYFKNQITEQYVNEQ